MSEIGPALTLFFKEKGITQEEIAMQLGVSQSYVSALLTGKKAFGKKNAKRFSELYGISPAWLLTGDGEMIVPGSVNTQVIGTNQGTAINGGMIKTKNQENIDFLSYAIRKDAQVDELLSQNGKLIDIIKELTNKVS